MNAFTMCSLMIELVFLVAGGFVMGGGGDRASGA